MIAASALPHTDPWRLGLARLTDTPPPTGYPAAAWRQIAADGAALLDAWGHRLHDLGWTTVDLFGLDPVAPWHAIHAAGLAVLLDGGKVVAITDAVARITCRSGVGQTFTRRQRFGAVPAWEVR